MKEILKSLAEGKISIEECETLLKAESIRQLDDVAQIDTSRRDRTGFPEAILADSKDYDDLLTIIKRFFEKQESDSDSIELKNNIIITRLSKERYESLEKDLDYLFEKGIKFDYNKRAKILIIYKDSLVEFNPEYGKVGLLTAGTSDIPIAEEAKVIVEQGGCEVISSYDIGVAGIIAFSSCRIGGCSSHCGSNICRLWNWCRWKGSIVFNVAVLCSRIICCQYRQWIWSRSIRPYYCK